MHDMISIPNINNLFMSTAVMMTDKKNSKKFGCVL